MSNVAVQINDLTKVFPNGTRALDGVTLNVPEGQLLALVGLSGSGKSTLLRHVNGLLQPTSGQITTLGTDLVSASTSDIRALRRNVGFVFQQFGLVGRISALENVLSGSLGRIKGPRFGVGMYSQIY